MAITIIRSSDAGAPTLTNAAGKLIEVFDFALVGQLGWVKEFSATNLKAAYKKPVGTNPFYLRINDSILAVSAKAHMCETMTNIDDMTTSSPLTIDLFIYKASSTSVVKWVIITDGKLVYFFSQGTNGSEVAWQWCVFGDFVSNKAGDAYNSIIIANTSVSATTTSVATGIAASSVAQSTGHYLQRSHTQLGSSTRGSHYSAGQQLGSSGGYLSDNLIPYPSPIDGGLHMAPVYIGEYLTGPRGRLQGAWAHGHKWDTFQTGDTFDGNGELVGKRFEYFAAQSCGVFMEISDTWDY